MPRLVIGTVVLLFVLAGCGGDPKAVSTPSPTPPPSTGPAHPSATTATTATPSSAPVPVMPAQASADTRAGAIAFVRYYVELINHLQSTGDGAPVVAVSAKGCRSCEAVVAAARALYAAGGRVNGGAWSIDDTVARHPSPTTWAVRVAGQLAPSTFTKSGSDTPTTRPGGKADARFVLTFDRTWKVLQWLPT